MWKKRYNADRPKKYLCDLHVEFELVRLGFELLSLCFEFGVSALQLPLLLLLGTLAGDVGMHDVERGGVVLALRVADFGLALLGIVLRSGGRAQTDKK